MITKMNSYDVVIIGGGIGGLMSAYGLMENDPSLHILLVEMGKDLRHRVCPMIKNGAEKCMKCNPCAIMEGMAGAGAFSDGKYIISTEYGGWLPDLVEPKTVINYIERADDILVKFGATEERYYPNDELKLKCLEHDLHMQQATLKHLGTDDNYNTMLKLIDDLEPRIEIVTETKVTDFNKDSHEVYLHNKSGEGVVRGEKVIIAVGRVGSREFLEWCKKNKIETKNNQVDIGVRVELPKLIWEGFSKKIYEPKIAYRSKRYGDTTRMFCFNEGGHVVTENSNGVLTVNGHSFREQERKSENSNFALLSTTNFTEPFNEPIEYARDVAALANKISGGSVLVQRLGDLEAGKRTDASRLRQSRTRPTLKAVPGDLSLCLPKRQLDNIVETLHALDAVAPGTANYDTLLYGVECKYYSARPKCTDFAIDGLSDVYAIGDGAGFTRSLSQAAANGLMVADIITKGTIQK